MTGELSGRRSEADNARVLDIINGMAWGQFDAIAFTSAPQVRQLRDVARATSRESDLLQGFSRTVVAAVGPIVASELEGLGVQVSITPAGGTLFVRTRTRGCLDEGRAMAQGSKY